MRAPITPPASDPRQVRGFVSERILRGLVVITALVAAGLIWKLAQKSVVQSSPPVRALPPVEERLDSAALGEISTMRGVSDRRLHRVIAILDPALADAGPLASDLARLSGEEQLRVAVSLFFAPQGSADRWAQTRQILNVQCAKRQGRLVEMLQAVATRPSRGDDGLAQLATRAQLTNPTAFFECIRRRDTAQDLSEALWLIQALRLSVLPAFIVDSSVVRGPITLDSIRARLRTRGE
jgi:hypothetical protein